MYLVCLDLSTITLWFGKCITVYVQWLNAIFSFLFPGEALRCNCGGASKCSGRIETCSGFNPVCASMILQAGSRKCRLKKKQSLFFISSELFTKHCRFCLIILRLFFIFSQASAISSVA